MSNEYSPPSPEGQPLPGSAGYLPTNSLYDYFPPDTTQTIDIFNQIVADLYQETDTTQRSEFKHLCVEAAGVLLETLADEQVPSFLVAINENYHGVFSGMDLSLVSSNQPNLVMINTHGRLEQLLVTRENAQHVLKDIKIADNEKKLGFSYALRHELLKRSAGIITTADAYVYAPELPEGDDIYPYLNDPGNWLPERRALHDIIITEQYSLAQRLSERLNDTTPTVYALRGNTAAGKTTMVRNHPLFVRALDENGELSGSINPDTYKNILKRNEAEQGRQVVNHAQTHLEGAMIAKKIENRIAPEESSIVIDRRFAAIGSIAELEDLAAQYPQTKLINMLDLDVPLELSLVRVLSRPIGGDAPNVPFDAVAEGYWDIRFSRREVFRHVTQNDKITYYVLYVTDDNGKTTEAAHKYRGQQPELIQGAEALFFKARDYRLARWLINELTETVITEEYISNYLERFFSDEPSSSAAEMTRASLSRHIGKTLKQALNEQAQKLNE